jgi:FKBP-type peptidyl-prolyl cis-trans isomerase SlyD
MRIRLSCLAAFFAVFLFAAYTHAAEKTNDERVVKDGQMVSLHYTVKGTDGKVIDSSKDKEPMKYIHGRNMMIPGLEKELTGMKVGGEKHVTVKPEDAYGPVSKDAFHEIPKDKLPANGLKVGAMLTGQGPQGQPIQARVYKIKEKTVVVDFNHPLAGRTLNFDVKVVDIQPAPPPPAQPLAPAAPGKTTAPAQPAKPAAPAQTK